jgi:hypothetical protein
MDVHAYAINVFGVSERAADECKMNSRSIPVRIAPREVLALTVAAGGAPKSLVMEKA